MHSRFLPAWLNGRGFTLIEMMAVLIVVGIAAGVVMLSMGDATRPREVRNAARGLYDAMGLALEDAIFLNRQLGLRFDISGEKDQFAYTYQWLYFDPEKRQWQDLPLEDFQSRDLPDFIRIELQVDGQTVTLGASKKNEEMFKVEEDKEGRKGESEPDLFFLSSGEMQAFRLAISDKDEPDRQYIISGDVLGQMTFRRPDEDEK